MVLGLAYGESGGGGGTAPTILDFSSAVHDHVDLEGGGVLNHNDLSGIGVNSHLEIDDHLSAVSAHGVTGNIVGSDGAQTLSLKTLITPVIADFINAGHDHADAAGGSQIDHVDLLNAGSNTHGQLDTHLANAAIHFAEASIDHAAIANSGSNSHAMIDSHLAATAAHGATGAVVGTTNAQTLTGKTLVTPTIADFTNAQHDHSNAAGGGEIPSRFSMRFYGEGLGGGVTSVELMEENTDIGIPLVRALRTARVAVKFLRISGAAPGDWTLRLFKNGIEVATFSVATT